MSDRKKNQEIIEEARRNFKLSVDSESKQRIREREDLKFQVPELQWDEQSRQQRGPGLVSGTQIPPRPTLAIPKLNQPIQIINGQMRQSLLGVSVHPLNEKARKATAQVIQGLYRAIERDCGAAEIVRPWAFDRAVKAGRGVYRVNKVYDEYSSNRFDQKITIERILYQENVYLDPSAQMPDWSDGNWAFHVAWMSRDEYKRKFPKSMLSNGDQSSWASAFQDAPDWIRHEGDGSALLVAEYFRKNYGSEMLTLLSDGAVITGELGDLPPGVEIVKQREAETCKIEWYKLNGLEIIDQGPWDGRYIPLIPMIGNELQPFDRERRWHGIIYPARDAQRLFNFAASGAVEMAALEPRAPWIIDPRQVEGYEDWWKQSNMRNFPYLPYKATMEGGAQIPAPARVQIDANRLGPNMMLLDKADDFIMSATTFHEAALGQLLPKDRSGRAIEKLQNASSESTSVFMDNAVHVSLPYEARVVLDLMPSTYERPGRIAEILEGPDKSKRVMLNIPFTQGPEGPQIAPEGAEGAEQYMLTHDAVYGVTTDVSKSYKSRLEAGKEEITELLSSIKDPGLTMILLPEFMKFQDEPWAEGVAKALMLYRDSQLPMLKQLQPQGSPEQIMQQLQGLMQENEGLKQGIAKLTQAHETEQAKQQADIQTTKMEGDTKVSIAQMQAQVDLQIAKLNAQVEMLIAKLKVQSSAAETGAKMAHEDSMAEKGFRQEGALAMHGAAENEKAREHESVQAAMGRGHELMTGMASQQHESQESDKERRHEGASQMAEQAHQSSESDKSLQSSERLAKMKPQGKPKNG